MFYTNIGTFIVATTIFLLAFGTSAYAAGFVHFKPENGDTVVAGKPVIVNGTSAPSNATHPSCSVQLSTNQGPNVPAKALGPGGPSDFTKWTITTPPMKPGHNELQAQFECVKPGNASGLSFVHHLEHNLTATTIITSSISHSQTSKNPQSTNAQSQLPQQSITPPTVG